MCSVTDSFAAQYAQLINLILLCIPPLGNYKEFLQIG
jgi:hypothetical protein